MSNDAMPANITTCAQSAIERCSYHTRLGINLWLVHLRSNMYSTKYVVWISAGPRVIPNASYLHILRLLKL